LLLSRNHRNPNFQQLAKDKKLNPNQWKVHLIEFNFVKTLGLIPTPKSKSTAQHAYYQPKQIRI
jgi:hypothetical protein